ncbi:type IA DNA topoisomerase [Riemerella columbipharyngis]|uniref:DNA topoisomerase n=1 Tax=Riemerella columbipharyngis TaxID=1071918 RepID=A0A1G6ZD19_9FLAO|nr:type IA DNA topoisomerase [Riemerella columbipharyngis]SDE00352.1 DNA topoisomerase-3 [Riemerella columbipharyngis]
MKLIIAEKPAQARDYANALGGFTRKDGYLESSEYYITWCFGHLVELAKDTAYREGTKWEKSYLPLLPKTFQYSIGTDAKGNVDAGKKKQLDLIKTLADKSSEIINATDADREGELIFRYVYNYLKLDKPFKRLWMISSLTKGDILKGFSNLLSSDEVKNLSKSGYARAISDWLIGINGTQSATLQLGGGQLLSIGRVQTAILKIICERYLKNKDFKTSYTYRLKANHNQPLEFDSKTAIFETELIANNYLNQLDKQKHQFVNSETKTTQQAPPLLFSIDTLIVSCNKLFNLSGQETLNIAQSLYEKKLTTYPRTDSNYINEENFSNLKKFIPSLSQELLQIDFYFSVEKPKSVNAEKLTGSHDAIVPTGQTDNYEGLTEKEKQVYQLILRRCLESFSTPAQYEKTTYKFLNNTIKFTTNTSILIDSGWKRYSLQNTEKDENQDEDEKAFKLDLKPNEFVPVTEFEIVKIESKPPALYTDANLTPALTHIDKFLQEENPALYQELKQKIDLKDVQIGTQATRPAIIERLKKLNLIKVEKKKYIPTETGLNYYNTIKDLQVSNIANTAILEKQLKDIQEGNISENQFYTELNQYVTNVVNDIFSLQNNTITKTKQTKKAIGICPKCKKGNVIEGKKGFGCTEWKQGCDFVIWKQIAGKKITESNVKSLIEKGTTSKIKGFKSKAGKPFEAKLTLNDDFRVEFNFNF